jgi:aspartate kinase
MRILKFGGTSVGSAQRIKNLADIIPADGNCLVVLSAMSGTTNSLIEIAEAYSINKKYEALEMCTIIKDKYLKVAFELFYTQEWSSKAVVVINTVFRRISQILGADFRSDFYCEIVAQGEILSTNLFHLHLCEIGRESLLVNALDYMKTDRDGEPDYTSISRNLFPLIENCTKNQVIITQGFLCRDASSCISNLGRGGSDYSAAILGNILDASVVEIWTDIDGIHNNDPRFVLGTQPVRELSFDEAAELSYFGAKILHPSTIHPCRVKNIPVMLKNTLNPTDYGTVISSDYKPAGIKAIAAKDGIIAIKIRSSRMLQAHGFMSRVFEIFGEFQTPVDMITTSEVAVSLTIDNPENLDKIVQKLSLFSSVSVDLNQSIICIVGDMVAEKTGYANRVFQALQNVPIRMISYGGSLHNISVLVSTEHKVEALKALNSIVQKNSLQTTAELC